MRARRPLALCLWVTAVGVAGPPPCPAGQAPIGPPTAGSAPPAAPARPRPPVAAPLAPRVSPGERLYMRGISVAGSPIEATVQGDIHVKGSDMACVNCHRRSGMGTAEGPLVVPPLVGSVLFSPLTVGAPQLGPPRTTGPGTRERLHRRGTAPRAHARAWIRRVGPFPPPCRDSPSARPMPRPSAPFCAPSGEQVPPGVSEAIVHLATIVTPGVSAARRASMLDILRTFVRAKNGGTRYETRRRTKGPWDMKQQYQGYRDWVLDEWELHGAPKEWPAQLEELYRRQPVYAIVSGIAEEDWSPIDAFCARYRIPAVLPQTPLPPAVPAGDGFYSLYFSKGVIVEAQAIAHHLASASPSGEVRQVSRCGTPGEVASGTLARPVEARRLALRLRPLVPGAHGRGVAHPHRRGENARVVARRQRPGGPRSPRGLAVPGTGGRRLPVVEPARRRDRPVARTSPSRAPCWPIPSWPPTSSRSTRSGRSCG